MNIREICIVLINLFNRFIGNRWQNEMVLPKYHIWKLTALNSVKID